MIDRPRTLFDAIRTLGHEMDFEPLLIPEPTATRPGSMERLEVYRLRLDRGEDLYHFGDETIAAAWDMQLEMLSFARSSAKDIRDSKRTAKSAQSWANANAAKRRLREMRLGK